MWRKIVLFILIFCPAVVLYKVMNDMLPYAMRPVNLLMCLLLIFFGYVCCTIKTETVIVKKKQVVRLGGGQVKQLCVEGGRCFDVWGGFDVSMILIAPWVYLGFIPRLTDEEFRKIKVGQLYRIKHYCLLGNKNRCIWSVAHDKSKKVKKRKMR